MGELAQMLVTQWQAAGLIPAGFERRSAAPVDTAALIRRQQRADRARYWHAQCPRLYRQSRWDHPRLVPFTPQINQVRQWQASDQGLLITGPTGRGKSRALWALLRRLLAHEGREVRVWRSLDFFRLMQEQINYGRDESRAWIKAVARIPIIALDDWGQEAVTTAKADWCQATCFDLLDQRLGEGRPMIVTTNLTAQQIADSDAKGVRANPLLRRVLDTCAVVRFETPAPN